MKLSKYSKPVPNRKIFHEPANSPVTRYTMTREEMDKHLKGAGG